MKKILFSAVLPLLLFVHSFFPTATLKAKAETPPASGAYACILTDAAFFYTAAEETYGLFLLPKTYYVKLLEYRQDFCKIEYQAESGGAQKLIGYAKTQDLTFVDYIPARPYLYYTFEVRYKIENVPQGNSAFLNELVITCVYYGDYKVGSQTYCYVLRGEEFGYIPKPTGLSFEENTEYADYLKSKSPTASEDTPLPPEQANSPAQIAILITLCLLVPVLAALILKPPRRPPYEEEI
ncbi:MAG: hypothetical protein IKB20_02820 [Clostridia bacterium]|nr:hypothetical protein [Clostridia bacterium]